MANGSVSEQLEPGVRAILDEYIRQRESALFYRSLAVSVSSILVAIGLIGGAFLFIKDEATTRAELVATQKIQTFIDEVLYPEVRTVRSEIERQRSEFNGLRSEMSASYGNIARTAQQVEALHEKAQRALEGLNKGEGSLVFAREILNLRTDLMRLEAAQNVARFKPEGSQPGALPSGDPDTEGPDGKGGSPTRPEDRTVDQIFGGG